MKFPCFVIALLLGLGLCAPAPAQYYPYSTPTYTTANDPDYTDPRVRFCQNSSQCVIFVPPCRAPVAVNNDVIPALESWKAATRYRFGCNVMKINIYNRASCINNSCVIVDSYYNSQIKGDPNNPRYCEAPSDCSVAVSPCGKKVAVNTDSLAVKQAQLDAEGPCAGAIDDRPVLEVHCDYGKCNVLMDNHPQE